MKSKIFKIYSSIFIAILFFNACNLIGAGSFSQAEYYFLNYSKEELIKEIEAFKIKYPDYRFVQVQPNGNLKEETDHYFRNFYIAYFYLSNYNLVMHCVLKSNADNSVRIGLYATSDATFHNLGAINGSDFSKIHNSELKKIFEKEVLAPLKEFISNQE